MEQRRRENYLTLRGVVVVVCVGGDSGWTRWRYFFSILLLPCSFFLPLFVFISFSLLFFSSFLLLFLSVFPLVSSFSLFLCFLFFLPPLFFSSFFYSIFLHLFLSSSLFFSVLSLPFFLSSPLSRFSPVFKGKTGEKSRPTTPAQSMA
jgi:hypothetical protein